MSTQGRPFRFGVQVADAESDEHWREKARRIEALGYSTLYMPDHFVGTRLAPIPAMATAAAVTDTLRIASLVFDNDFKHPALLAKEAATIDLLSDGRLELGIGAGWMESDYTALGLPYDPAGVRIERLAEAVQVVKGCFGPGPFSFEGKHYTVREYDGLPKPVQQPGPPLLIGGGGRKILTLAGREADIVGINPNLRAGAVTTDTALSSLAAETRKKIEWVREAAGDRFDDIELQIRYFVCIVTDDRQGVAEAMAPGFGVSPEEVLEAGVSLVGTLEEMEEQLLRRREEWGVSNVVVDDDMFEALAPLVARLAGM